MPPSRLPAAWRGRVLLTGIATVALMALISGLVAQELEISITVEEPLPRPAERLREGTELVDRPGIFKLTGDRPTFYPADGSGKLGGLENLTLERVATTISEDPTPQEWLVSGVVTEFRGNNYILVTRAILKTRPAAFERSGRPMPAFP